MAVTITSPVTGAAQTGLTTPTYTHVPMAAPSILGKQVAVTALGGTQTGVVAHSASQPFTTTMFVPGTYKMLGKANPSTGVIAYVPVNTYKFITRKGVLPLAGQAPQTMIITTQMDVVAGSEIADPNSISAALSMHFGSITQQSAGFGDTLRTGIA